MTCLINKNKLLRLTSNYNQQSYKGIKIGDYIDVGQKNLVVVTRFNRKLGFVFWEGLMESGKIWSGGSFIKTIIDYNERQD